MHESGGGRRSSRNSRNSHHGGGGSTSLQQFTNLEKFRLRFTLPCAQAFTRWKKRNFLKVFFFRELFENGVQLLGLMQEAAIGDVDDLFIRAVVLSLNLILLPLVAAGAHLRFGSVFSKGVAVVIEKLFDKVFVISGIIFRAQSR